MDYFSVLVLTGFLIGTIGTLIGAGGGFILVPLLILTHPEMPTETISAISMAIVAVNGISGSIAYARSGRIDYKAGWTFGLYTIPGSILGVFATGYFPQFAFQLVFGGLLIAMAVFLFVNKKKKPALTALAPDLTKKNWKCNKLTDKGGHEFYYCYNQNFGIVLSVLVGFISPLLGIGGGIIYMPAMVQWLEFPVYIATATSNFILAIMSSVSVIVHAFHGTYDDSDVLRMVLGLALGVIPGAQMGAYISHRIPTRTVIKVLAVCLALVGIRILSKNLYHIL